MFTLRHKRAFTLIELLIVITIIGILAVALVPRLTGGPGRARDAQRKGDLQQVATALEFFADDNGGEYPSVNSCVSGLGLTDYLTSIPDDPQGTGVGSCTTGYSYTGISTDGGSTYTGYLLMAPLESETASGDGIYDEFTPSASTEYSSQISGATAACTADCVYVTGR